jgi:predicted DsbA family dithiol-disulfide isomerase
VGKLEVEIWSDIACPWCYVGKRRFERALEGFAHRDEVTIVWRSFELDADAPRLRTDELSHAERLAKKYGRSPEEGEQMIAHMTKVGASEGIDFAFDKVRSGNTFDAHRLLHLAKAHGLADVANERLLRAYFSEGAAIGDRETLVKLAAEIGLGEAETRAMLDGPDYVEAVQQDEAEAHAIGIRGVPCFIVGRRYGVSGAQPPEALREVLDKAWADAARSKEG